MATDPLAFLDEQISHPSARSDKSMDPLSFLDKPQAEQLRESFGKFLKSKPPENLRNIGADIITTGTAMAGLPGDIASIFGLETPLTSEKLREKSFELIPSLAPKNEQEKAWDEGLSFVMGFGTPSGLASAPIKLIGKGIGKAGGKAAVKALKGKYRELYEIGKNLGIDEKALAPFKHGKVTGSVLKNLAKLGETAKKGIKFAEDLASPFYQKLNDFGSQIPLNNIVKRSVTRDFTDLISDIKKSPALASESKDVVKFLSEAANNLKSGQYTVEGLMDLYRHMNKTVNWRSLKSAGKGNLINKAKESVMKGIYGMSPKLGKEFTDMNKLYTGYKNLAKEVSPNKLWTYASKGGPVGYALLSALTGKDLQDAATKALGLYFGKKAIGKISGKLLTDPKWVGLKEKTLHSLKKGSKENMLKILQAIKKKSEMDQIDPEED